MLTFNGLFIPELPTTKKDFSKQLKELINLYDSGCGWYNIGTVLKRFWADSKGMDIHKSFAVFSTSEWQDMCEYWDSIIDEDVAVSLKVPRRLMEKFFLRLLEKLLV